jgi:hypothetical protein
MEYIEGDTIAKFLDDLKNPADVAASCKKYVGLKKTSWSRNRA